MLRAIHAGGHNPKEIAASLGMSSRGVSASIQRLLERNLLTEKHPYELTPKGLEAVQ